jgi:hypothetical protein
VGLYDSIPDPLERLSAELAVALGARVWVCACPRIPFVDPVRRLGPLEAPAMSIEIPGFWWLATDEDSGVPLADNWDSGLVPLARTWEGVGFVSGRMTVFGWRLEWLREYLTPPAPRWFAGFVRVGDPDCRHSGIAPTAPEAVALAALAALRADGTRGGSNP